MKTDFVNKVISTPVNAVSLLESRETGFICAENEAVKK